MATALKKRERQLPELQVDLELKSFVQGNIQEYKDSSRSKRVWGKKNSFAARQSNIGQTAVVSNRE